MKRLVLDLQPGTYTVSKAPAGAKPPVELFDGDGFVVITQTSTELAVTSLAEVAPEGWEAHPDWRILSVRGPLDITMTGVMASLASSLAAAGVSICTLSTFDTDHVLVGTDDLDRAVGALTEAGHEVDTSNG